MTCSKATPELVTEIALLLAAASNIELETRAPVLSVTGIEVQVTISIMPGEVEKALAITPGSKSKIKKFAALLLTAAKRFMATTSPPGKSPNAFIDKLFKPPVGTQPVRVNSSASRWSTHDGLKAFGVVARSRPKTRAKAWKCKQCRGKLDGEGICIKCVERVFKDDAEDLFRL